MSRKKYFLDRKARRFFLEIQPTVVSALPAFACEVLLGPVCPSCEFHLLVVTTASRVLKLGKRTWSWRVNHGSIGGS